MSTPNPSLSPEMAADLKSDILLCTVYLHRLVRNQARQSAENWAELSVLNNLEHWGERAGSPGLSQKELAGFEQVSQAAMSNIVRKLRERGFVNCEKNQEDSRSVLVRLTREGRKHLATQGPQIKEVFDQLLENLSGPQIRKLAEGQRILSQALQESSLVQSALRG